MEKRSTMKPESSHIILLLFSMSLFATTPTASMAAGQRKATVGVKVGVILDLNRSYDPVGQLGLSCIEMALSDFYAARPNYTTRLLIHARDSPGDDVVQAASSAIELIKNVKVHAILGPETSMQAHFIARLAEKASVPVISFSASSPTIDASNHNRYFFRANPTDTTQTKVITAIVKSFGWREAVPIYIDNDFGNGIIPYLVDALEAINANVPYRLGIPPSATNDLIGEELYKLVTMQTRVFIVHMNPNMGARLFAKAREVGMMVKGYVWIMTDGITAFLNSMDRSVLESMQGVVGIKPYVPETRQVNSFRRRWKKKFYQDHPELMDAESSGHLNSYGLWAYDATTALAMAAENVNAKYTNLGTFANNTKVGFVSTDLERLGVFRGGQVLAQELSKTRFKGLSGDFVLEKGKLNVSDYEIVNVNGDRARWIGNWSPMKGLTKNLSSGDVSRQLGTIIWPGDVSSAPKGFEIPTNGKKLKIGVPVKHGFFEFVKVDNTTGVTTGYSIDVFEAVVKALPYELDFEYVPFAKPDGESAGNYNDLVYQVYLGKYDGVVGDITIRANRSKYVDFSTPYTESGVAMLVPARENRSNNAWVFLMPLTWELWVTTFLFFIFIGFVIWVLEHRINNDFRGPPSHQAGTSFWFSFSTMVFAHREKVVSNLTRTVMIIWCFVVLILTQSYTASLTSLLTVQQLQPTITNIDDLSKWMPVGFQESTFLQDLLTQQGYHNTVPFNSTEQCNSLFSQGKIVAALDELSYVKLFLAKHCSNYTMIDLPFKTEGFAFVFPKGSPLVDDISRAVLNVTEGDEMSKLQRKWFDFKGRCPDLGASVSSGSDKLGLNSFWSLFVIAGVAALSALFTFAAMFLYEHRNFLLHDSNPSLWGRILNLLKTFDNKDLECHTFRTERDNGEVNLANLNNAEQQQQSPSTYSVQEADVDHDSIPQTPITPPLGTHNDITPQEPAQEIETTAVVSDSHLNSN
ncbi:Glutamate receptor 2.7 [Linum grandiflorum]